MSLDGGGGIRPTTTANLEGQDHTPTLVRPVNYDLGNQEPKRLMVGDYNVTILCSRCL